jgi:prolyl-tRNA synthetase
MRQSQLFPKTIKQSPKDAVVANHKLLVRAGFIDQLMAGSWTLLPLGWRVIEKINQIIREEMNAIGGQEMLMPLMHPKDIWDQTKRWDVADEVMFKVKGKYATEGRDYGLAFTHEEIIMDLARKNNLSYRDLPIGLYHFSTKFRNETRTQGGLLRGREFLMKDLYSLHANEKDLMDFYEICKQAYLKIFERAGVEAIVVEASGGVFTTNHTHEFQVVCEAGEDTIYYDPKTKTGFNKEICDGLQKDLMEVRAVEVGNIFPFGTYYSEKMGVNFTDEDGKQKPVYFGSYGIGQTRLMGVIVETHNDEKGIIWPESVAPYKYHLIGLNGKGGDVYRKLLGQGVEVLFDDRDISAGEKFADADLMGIPYRLVVSEKTGDKIEIKKRGEDKTELINFDRLASS